MQNLVYDGGGQPLDPRPFLGFKPSEPVCGSLHLPPDNLIHLPAQRHDCGHDGKGVEPFFEDGNLFGDDLLRLRRLGLPHLPVRIDHVLQVVDIVEIDVFDLAGSGIDVPWDRDVDQKEQSVPLSPERLGHHLLGQNVARCAG